MCVYIYTHTHTHTHTHTDQHTTNLYIFGVKYTLNNHQIHTYTQPMPRVQFYIRHLKILTYFVSILVSPTHSILGPGSSVGIATDYGLDGPRLIPVGTRFSVRPERPRGPSSLLYNGYQVKCGRGVLLTTQPLLVPRSWKSTAISLPTLWATPGLQREHFTFTFFFF